MSNDNTDTRLAQAIKNVRELREYMDFGLAVTQAANEYEVDRTVLAKKCSDLAKEARAKRKLEKEEAKRNRFAKWKESDDRRYGWMND